MAEFDLSAYLGVFIDEVDEQLQILDTEILTLEQQPTNKETIQNIFRAAHTLKGSSASMGYEKMKELTHHLENVFEQIRQEHLLVTPHLITIMFESIDLIRTIKEAILQNTLATIDIVPAIDKLERFLTEDALLATSSKITSENYQLDEYQLRIIEEGKLLGHCAIEIQIKLVEDALMKNVRALLIQNTLKECGEVIATFPNVEDVENNEHFNGEMTFIILTVQTEEEIQARVAQISDIESILMSTLEENMQQNRSTQTVAEKVIDEEPKLQTKVAATVRVDVDKLEHLMNLVRELVIDQTRLIDVRGRFTVKEDSYEEEFEVLDDITNHLSRVISELQEGMMKTRMLPIEQLFNRFPRVVRDTAVKANKRIQFDMQGKETELDRTLIEEISDPIIHLLRNAVDHGVETAEERLRKGKPAEGKITLSAAHEENHVVIAIRDDGKGIDPAKIKQTSIEKGVITQEEAAKMSDKEAMFLIFQSGISTAEKITDISGRGVGMDIVRAHIEKLKGIIDIDSTIDQGTTFTIKLPLTLAIIRSLLVKFGMKTFAIPLVNVLEIIRIDKSDIQMIKNQEVGMIRGRVLPLVRMKERLGIADDPTQRARKREFVVIVGIADKRIGIIADKTIGNQEIVIKSLGTYIGSPPYISGATIMGDGSVALILDVSSIVNAYGTTVIEQQNIIQEKITASEQQVVTFKIATEEYGLEIQQTKDIIAVPAITKIVESEQALLGMINLRGNMIPVMDLRQRFHLEAAIFTKKSRIIIVEQQGRDIGLLVDEVTQVLKVNDLQIEQPVQQASMIKGISKLDQRVVLILDFNELFASITF